MEEIEFNIENMSFYKLKKIFRYKKARIFDVPIILYISGSQHLEACGPRLSIKQNLATHLEL